jgi:signal transduction histidine kinase
MLASLNLLTDTKLDTEQSDLLHIAQLSGEQLFTLINDIIDVSKIEENKLVLEDVEFYLHETLEDAMDMVSASAEKKGIELVCDISSTTPARVRGDPMRLRQVLLNLVGNAVKFTPSGEIVLRARLESFFEPCTATILVSVQDTGVGISPEVQKKLLQPFQQGDDTITRRYRLFRLSASPFVSPCTSSI